MVFTGTYEHSIDAKNRVAIPSDIRAQILEEEGRRKRDEQPVYLYVTLGEGQSLCLYTLARFEQRAADLDNSELESEEILEYERMMFSLARRVEMDQQGRVRLPENLREMSKLGPDVVLLGVKDHLEIRDRAAWQSHVRDVLARQPQIMMNPRRAMKKPAPPAPGSPPGPAGGTSPN